MKPIRHLAATVSMTLLFLFTTSISQGFASNDTPPADLTAKGAVVIDMKSGAILFDKDKDAHLYPASITKIMTAILALEHSSLDEKVKTSELARNQEGNRVYLEPGEEEPMEQMLYGLLINSGNDAAVAIAEHVGGSVENFAKMMNDKAAELGCRNTHFVTPNGLHDDNHYTSPYDMALIANYAMKNAKFREIVATENYHWVGQSWDSNLVNLNPMLWNYDGATGVKTGFTDQAEQTMVASAKRGDREVMAVVMGVAMKQTIRLETTALLDYGFDHFATDTVAHAGDAAATFDANGQKVNAVLKQDVYDTHSKDAPQHVTTVPTISLPNAPFPKGAKVGTIQYLDNGKAIASADLYSASDVFPPPLESLSAKARDHKEWLFICAAALLIALFVFRVFRRRARNRRSLDASV